MTKVLYPGSFDPITKGHRNIIEQASELFDEVIVAVMRNPLKKESFFSLEERVELIKHFYKNKKNITVLCSEETTVDLAVSKGCQAIIRGLRSLSDYDYEVGLQQINKELSDHQVNTVCLFADREYQFVSSSMVKEVFHLNKDITRYVGSYVQEKMLEKKGILRNE